MIKLFYSLRTKDGEQSLVARYFGLKIQTVVPSWGRAIFELARKNGHRTARENIRGTVGKGIMGIDTHYATLCPVPLILEGKHR